MKLMFNGLLSLDGIKPDEVQLVRHRDTRSALRHSPYSLWVDRREKFELYQRIQQRRVFRTASGSLIVASS